VIGGLFPHTLRKVINSDSFVLRGLTCHGFGPVWSQTSDGPDRGPNFVSLTGPTEKYYRPKTEFILMTLASVYFSIFCCSLWKERIHWETWAWVHMNVNWSPPTYALRADISHKKMRQRWYILLGCIDSNVSVVERKTILECCRCGTNRVTRSYCKISPTLYLIEKPLFLTENKHKSFIR